MLTQRIRSHDEAAEILQRGGLVAFPTETVFGLGVDATDTRAVERLFAAKGRPSDNPLIVHVGAISEWSRAATELPDTAAALLAAYAPGPLTVVLPKRAEISPLVSAGLPTVGVRIPDHPVARAILAKAQVPVAAPSANRSGRPSSTTWRAVLEDLDGRVDAVYCEDSTSIGIESTVVDCCGPVPVVLRPGGVTIEQVRRVVPQAEELPSSSNSLGVGAERVNSPGRLHPHYQPCAEVRLVTCPSEQEMPTGNGVAYCGLEGFPGIDRLMLSRVFESVEAYAAGFYEFLREVDRQGLAIVVVQAAPVSGIGRALLDRQCRAAGG